MKFVNSYSPNTTEPYIQNTKTQTPTFILRPNLFDSFFCLVRLPFCKISSTHKRHISRWPVTQLNDWNLGGGAGNSEVTTWRSALGQVRTRAPGEPGTVSRPTNRRRMAARWKVLRDAGSTSVPLVPVNLMTCFPIVVSWEQEAVTLAAGTLKKKRHNRNG